jgi:hypothetical protein
MREATGRVTLCGGSVTDGGVSIAVRLAFAVRFSTAFGFLRQNARGTAGGQLVRARKKEAAPGCYRLQPRRIVIFSL